MNNNIKEFTVVFAAVKYKDGTGSKERPVYILRRNETQYRVLRLTSKFTNKSKKIQDLYFEIKDWREAGLRKPSWIDTVQGYDLPGNISMRYIGLLTDRDTQRLFKFIDGRTDLFD